MRFLGRDGNGLMGVKFKGIDVLQDSEIREGIKEFTNWPTIPQLYVKGEFVGGCDIVLKCMRPANWYFCDKGVETGQNAA